MVTAVTYAERWFPFEHTLDRLPFFCVWSLANTKQHPTNRAHVVGYHRHLLHLGVVPVAARQCTTICDYLKIRTPVIHSTRILLAIALDHNRPAATHLNRQSIHKHTPRLLCGSCFCHRFKSRCIIYTLHCWGALI